MMKTVLFTLILACTLSVSAEKNPFLGREFWKTNPTPEQVKTQMEAGHSPSEFNAFNFDAIVYAILEKASFPTIQFLMEQPGNSAKKITHDGRNYLMWAGYKGDFSLVEYLIKQGSDMKLLDDKGNNVVTFTALGGTMNPKIYDAYEEAGILVKIPNRSGTTAIHYLVQHVDHLNQLDYFIKKGLSISSKDNENNTLFHYASAQGKTPVLKELIEKGLDPKAFNDNNENALFFTARGMRGTDHGVASFEYFVGLGLNPSLPNNEKTNLLHIVASSNKNKSVYTYLIKNKVDPQARDSKGNTPLIYAIQRNNTEAISILLPLTEDKKTVNNSGKSALTYALRAKNKELTEQLITAGVSIYTRADDDSNIITELVKTYIKKDRVFFDFYFDRFVKEGIKIQDITIHLATLKESKYLLSRLLKEGKDINVKNKDGLTPLQVSAMKGNDTVFINYLLEHGADKKVSTEFGESVYELAQQNELLQDKIEFLK